MARFRIEIKPSAAKELDAIPRKADRVRLVRKIEALANDPRPPGARKLVGDDRYRLRQGVYRILYFIEDRHLVVYVIKIGHRKDVYRGR